MKIDLCKLLGVEEGEEFKVEYEDHISDVKYRIMNNLMEWSEIGTKYEGDYYPTCFSLNDANKVKNIIRLPKKKQFSQDTLNLFKYIDKKFEWIAKDKDGEVWIYIDKPEKRDVSWENFDLYKPLDIIKDSLFDQILWEDEEPIYIDDYVER